MGINRKNQHFLFFFFLTFEAQYFRNCQSDSNQIRTKIDSFVNKSQTSACLMLLLEDQEKHELTKTGVYLYFFMVKRSRSSMCTQKCHNMPRF